VLRPMERGPGPNCGASPAASGHYSITAV